MGWRGEHCRQILSHHRGLGFYLDAVEREWLIQYLLEAQDEARAASTGSTERGQLTAKLPQLIKILTTVLGEGYARILISRASAQNWVGVRETLGQAIYHLEEGAKVTRALGPPPSPTLRADALHPTVWDTCGSFWRSKHFSAAVSAAARAVNAALQARVERRDVSDRQLVREAFSLDPPQLGRPRLRIWPDDGSQTYRSLHEGASAFGAGCFQAIRNPNVHEGGDEIPENLALEQLAAFSILARWVDDAEVVTVDAGHPQDNAGE